MSLVFTFVASYAWTHRRHIALAEEAAPQTEATYAEAREAQKMVTITGPMADYMSHQQPSSVETLQPISHKPVASDHVGGSPVGTSEAILHSTFSVKNAVDLPFEIPAHAANAQLRGTYRSFVQKNGAPSSDSTAEVEFLLFNEQQYADFLNGRPSDALFSADSAHEGEANCSLPPTLSHAAKYHLVFRNSSRTEGKKIVQADFRVDF